MHQGPAGVTSAILVSEQAPTMNTMVPALQCATVIMCAPLPLQGPTVNVLLLVQRASLAMPLPVPGPVYRQELEHQSQCRGRLSCQRPAHQCFSGCAGSASTHAEGCYATNQWQVRRGSVTLSWCIHDPSSFANVYA